MDQEEFKKLLEQKPHLRELMEIYGMPRRVMGLADCSTLPTGAICMETACRNGKKLILRCGPNGCTEDEIVSC